MFPRKLSNLFTPNIALPLSGIFFVDPALYRSVPEFFTLVELDTLDIIHVEVT